MNHVRIHGDPFGQGAVASRLRSFLRLAVGSGMKCSLSLGAVASRPVSPGETAIPLTDGVANLQIGTRLPPAEIELLVRAAGAAVVATAPVVVFADAACRAASMRMAGLEWADACAVLFATPTIGARDLLQRVRAELRWAGVEHPPHALGEQDLAPWLALPLDAPAELLVHVGSADPAAGTDLVVSLWRDRLAASGRRLRLVMPDAADHAMRAIEASLAAVPGTWEIAREPLQPRHVADAAAIVLPWRATRGSADLVKALASGRTVCVSRFAATAPLIPSPGICVPIGGTSAGGRFEPNVDAMLAAAQAALADTDRSIGRRGRRHAEERLVRGCPAPPAASPAALGDSRPSIVLEAPFFETSSSAELSIETARALLARGNVDLRLVARTPFAGSLQQLRQRAPELEQCLVRQPGRVDLWLSAGWPVRADRPDCAAFALRVDWEYGALPVELTPHVPGEADLVVVHSEHVCAAVTAAGRSPDTVHVVPHGVDAAMTEDALPDPDIVRWKQGRPAVLFCGGMVWRKGFDVFLRSVLAARAGGADFVVVVKSVGHERHYGRFNLRALVDRFVATPGTPPLLLVERDLTRLELASLYRACDLMLHPYRGEGFCMPALEARAVGLPVLATAGGATEAFLDGPGAVRIPSARREIELPGAHVATPWVLEPCPLAAARLLAETLHDLPRRREAARAAAPGIRSRFSWDAAAVALEGLARAARAGRRTLAVPESVVVLRAAEPRKGSDVAVVSSR